MKNLGTYINESIFDDEEEIIKQGAVEIRKTNALKFIQSHFYTGLLQSDLRTNPRHQIRDEWIELIYDDKTGKYTVELTPNKRVMVAIDDEPVPDYIGDIKILDNVYYTMDVVVLETDRGNVTNFDVLNHVWGTNKECVTIELVFDAKIKKTTFENFNPQIKGYKLDIIPWDYNELEITAYKDCDFRYAQHINFYCAIDLTKVEKRMPPKTKAECICEISPGCKYTENIHPGYKITRVIQIQ